MRYFPIILLLLFTACEEDDRNQKAVQAMIEEEVNRRLENYREARMRRCWEEALDEASQQADSILLMEARQKRDTMGKPPKPAKPERPEIKSVQDSVPIKPLLPAGEQQDTSEG